MQYNHIKYLKKPHFKDNCLQFFAFNFFPLKKMTLANNCWQCLEQNKIKQVCQKNVVRFFQ